jgi:hypothetical protein
LFPLIDDKRTVKKGSGFDDEKLGRAACDYLLTRLKPSNGEQPLPEWYQLNPAAAAAAATTTTATTVSTSKPDQATQGNDSQTLVSDVKPKEAAETAATDTAVIMEQQAIIDKLSHDTWELIEKCPPEGLLNENKWFVEFNERKKLVQESSSAAVANDEANDGGGIETSPPAPSPTTATTTTTTTTGEESSDRIKATEENNQDNLKVNSTVKNQDVKDVKEGKSTNKSTASTSTTTSVKQPPPTLSSTKKVAPAPSTSKESTKTPPSKVASLKRGKSNKVAPS